MRWARGAPLCSTPNPNPNPNSNPNPNPNPNPHPNPHPNPSPNRTRCEVGRVLHLGAGARGRAAREDVDQEGVVDQLARGEQGEVAPQRHAVRLRMRRGHVQPVLAELAAEAHLVWVETNALHVERLPR